LIERFFRLKENQTSVRAEFLGGLTTFITMAYIVVVNPQILSKTGMPVEGVVFATCLSSAVATLVMGLYANYPIALAPGMSLNAYFTYTVCLGMRIPWQTALGVIFFSGVSFLILTVSRVREQIVNGIPECLKHSTAAGIGMFIAFVGLRNANLVVANPATFVSLGSLAHHEAQLACIGLAIILILMTRRITGAILIGVLATTGIAILGGMASWPTSIFSMPHPSSTFLKLDLRGALQPGPARDHFRFSFYRSFRQCRNPGWSVRARWLCQRRQDPAGRTSANLRCGGHHLWRLNRDLNRHKLYRERGRCGRGRKNRIEQPICRSFVLVGGVLRSVGSGDSGLRDGSGTYRGWSAHD